MNHPDVIETNERPVCSHSQVVVVPRVDRQTLGLNQLTTKLCEVNEHLGVFTILPQVILSVVKERAFQMTSFVKSRACAFPLRLLPDDAVFRGAPEGVGPHGCRGNTFDSVGVVGKHMDGLLHGHIVHMDLCVGRTSYQYPVSRMRKELWEQTKINNPDVDVLPPAARSFSELRKKNTKEMSIFICLAALF